MSSSTRTADVDVIIPLYNVERYIAEAMRSVLQQTLPPARLIVVDDGSKDGGANVVRSMQQTQAGPTAIVLLQKTNGGLSSARNHGLQHASARWVAFLDADDRWAPEKLEMQMAVIERARERPVMVYCGARTMDGEGHVLASLPAPASGPLEGHIFERLLPRNEITGSASAVVLDRSVLDRVGHFDQALSALEDFDLWLRMSQQGPVAYVNADLVDLRTHGENMSKDRLHMLKNIIAFQRKWFAHAQGRPEVMHEWGHLIADVAARAKDRKAARRMAEEGLTTEQKRALFSRTFGSLGLYMFLKRLRWSLGV